MSKPKAPKIRVVRNHERFKSLMNESSKDFLNKSLSKLNISDTVYETKESSPSAELHNSLSRTHMV